MKNYDETTLVSKGSELSPVGKCAPFWDERNWVGTGENDTATKQPFSQWAWEDLNLQPTAHFIRAALSRSARWLAFAFRPHAYQAT